MSKPIDHSARAHAVLSASSSSRWLKCPPSAVAATMYPSTGTEFTREGTLAHEVAEAITRERFDMGVKYHPDWGPDTTTGEMYDCAVAYADYIEELITDPDAVVLLEQRLDLTPWVPDGFGTADCIIIQGNRLDIVDYKFGQGVAVSAEDNSQMRLYALGAYYEFGDIYDITEVGMHIFQPRLNNISADEMPAVELLAWGCKVKPIAEQAARGKGDYCSGEHCRFCPHAGNCPTLAADCLKVVNLGDGKAAVPTMQPWMVADILKQEPLITGWLKAVKERALSQMLSGEEIPGYKVVEGRGSRDWRSADEVEAFMESSGFQSAEYLKTELLSPYQMERSIGKKRAAELLSDFIITKPGSPTIAPATDKRETYHQQEASRKAFE